MSKKTGTEAAYKTMQLCKALLLILGSKPPKGKPNWQWTMLEKQFIKNTAGSSAQFYSVILYAIRQGWVEKIKRGVYCRTQKGEALLEALEL